MDSEQLPMKQARISVGVAVDGCAVMARVMIRADHDVCKYCLGSGRDQNDEECEPCEGLGTVPQTGAEK